MVEYMNPYNFVRLLPMQKGQRKTPVPHSTSAEGLLSGKLTCTLTALGPIFIPHHDSVIRVPLPPFKDRQGRIKHRNNKFLQVYSEFFHGADHRPLIPASSLRGAIRSVAEAAANGCLSIFAGTYYTTKQLKKRSRKYRKPFDYSRKVKQLHLQPCSHPEHLDGNPDSGLCPTCRLFGMPSSEEGESEAGAASVAFAGRVFFTDALLLDEKPNYRSEPVLLTELSSPDATSYLYVDEEGNLRGRKFYYHRSQLYLDDTWQKRALKLYHDYVNHGKRARSISQPVEGNDGLDRKVCVRPLQAGSRFRFEVTFRNLSQEELDLLLYALTLDAERDEKGAFKPGAYHKIGYGKPAGLGSAAIVVEAVHLEEEFRRYGIAKDDAQAMDVQKYIPARRSSFLTAHKKDLNLVDLRAILHWPNEEIEIQYPPLNQFGKDKENGYKLPQPDEEPRQL